MTTQANGIVENIMVVWDCLWQYNKLKDQKWDKKIMR